MKFSFGMLDDVFILPSSIVDNYIKTAGTLQIKVLLWIFRHLGQNFELSDISDDLSSDTSDIKDAIQYWYEIGVLNKVDCIGKDNIRKENIVLRRECESNRLKSENNFKGSELKLPSRYEKTNVRDISKRMIESEEIKVLMQEAQQILGKTITNSDSGILLTLHDRDGLPVDVILMILQYAVSVGKRNMNYIEKIGRSWAEEEIDTLEKAENKIKKLCKENILWNKFEKIIGIEHRAPTSVEKEAIIRWMSEWKYDDKMLKEAYDRCVNANGKYVIKYMDSIISRWYRQGISSIAQAMDENKKADKINKSKYSSKPSYNIEEYEKYSIFDEDEWEKHFIGG